ncbi:hypothetical protein BVRB_4g093000 [Beta vulgaris subsp. vulgaris]|nr:hypothetical protein BVRB_4g093000 [Beta vulgaris subsp. vulgaris]
MESNDVQKAKIIRKGMIIGVVAAIIASVLAFLKVNKLKTRRPKIIRQPYVNRDSLREANIDSVLYCGDSHCLGQIRMRPSAFYSLCNILVEKGLLSESKQMSVKEQVLLFLYVLGDNVRFRDVGGRFFRSTWTIHCYFHIVLQAILRLYPYVVKPPGIDLQPEIQNNSRFFPWFEDFIGAIDGTHVRASVPLDMQERFRGRKDKTTQNVLASVDFDLKFTYVLAGWEGSAHDSRVLGDALKKGFNVPEEVRKGKRPNNTFRTSSFIAAAKMISEKFHTACTADHVENHMRTVRSSWGIISQVQGRSGFGWNDNVKMVTASPTAYDAYIQQYPSHEKYLNKKIEMHEEISIVAGKDIARGNFCKTFGDIQTSSGQPSTVETEPTKSDSATSSEPRSHRKRSRVEEEEGDLQHISAQLGEVVSALKNFSQNQLVVQKLY